MIKSRWKNIACSVLCMIMLTGCSKGISVLNEKVSGMDYTVPEMMIVVANERNRYQEVYTDQIWSALIGKDGTTFQDYLLEQIRYFLENMKTMNLLAKEKGIELTAAEKEEASQLADKYFASLSEADLSYINVTKENVEKMYLEYSLANKTVNELTKDINLEISDSEAKVISVYEIATENPEMAQEVLSKIEEGSDFTELAQTYSANGLTKRQISRGEEENTLENAAFALSADEVSGIIHSGNQYLILKCIDDYDEEATLKRKEELYKERKNLAFRQIYDQFKTEHTVTITDETWSEINVSGGPDSTTDNFFTLYQEFYTK